MPKLPSKLSDKAIKAEGLWSFGDMVRTIYGWIAAGVAGMTAAAWAYVDWFWNTFGWAGVISLGVITFFVVVFSLNLWDLWRRRRVKDKRNQWTSEKATQEPSSANAALSTATDKAARLIPMDAAVRYISRESRWIVDQRSNPQWPFKLRQDLHDALRQGTLIAYGRKSHHNRVPPDGFKAPLQAIGNRTWQENRPEIMDGIIGNPTSNAAMAISAANLAAFYDLHFDRDQIEMLWPPLDTIRPLTVR